MDELARALSTDAWVVTAVLPQIGRRLGGRVIEADTVDGKVHVRTATWDRLVSWDQRLSGGERAALFFELAIAIADLQSEVEPTLLAFDGALSVTDNDTREHLLNLMSSADRSFQSVILQERPLRAGQEWMVTYFARTEWGACLRQDAPDGIALRPSIGSTP